MMWKPTEKKENPLVTELRYSLKHGDTFFILSTNVYPVDARDVRKAVEDMVKKKGGDVGTKKSKGYVRLIGARAFVNIDEP